MMAPAFERGQSGGRMALLLVAVLALVLGSVASTAQSASAAVGTTTANLNLRQGPGTTFAVAQVVPSGSSVEVTGTAQFGYVPVTYGQASGWVLETYLTNGGSGQTGTRYVFDGRLNLRSGPGTSYGVVAVMPDGAEVSLAGETSNGFARMTWNGQSGWAATQYLATTPPGGSTGQPSTGDTATSTATTSARVYVRNGPATTYGALTVVPATTEVEVMGSATGDFTPIRYDGVKGWVATSFLTTPAPTEVRMVTTAAVNLRSGAGTTTAVQRVLPPGTAVTVTGVEQNGFLPVTWNTLSGFVASDWLAEPGSGDDPGTVVDGDEDIVAIIYAAADRWGQPRADMLRVARCESNLDPSAVNSSSGASGLFQFMPSTFAFTPNGKRGENIFDAYSSADATGWMWANGMRNHWECQ